MVNYFVLELTEAVIGFQCIGEQRGTGKHTISHLTLKGFLFGIIHSLSAEPSSSASSNHDA